MMNRATAETSHDAALEEGTAPVMNWIKDLIDDVLENEMDAGDYEFQWLDDQEVDPVKQETILSNYVKNGIMSVNEARDQIGLEPDSDPAADGCMVYTASGFAPLGANTIEGKKASIEAFGQPQQVQDDSGEKPLPKKEVGKMSTVPFLRKARLKPLNEERALVQHHRIALAKKVSAGLHDLGKHVAAQARVLLRHKLGKTAKDDEEAAAANAATAQDIADQLDLDGIDFLIDATEEDLAAVAADSAQRVLAQIGVTDNGDLVNQVNDAAVAYARDRAAEMVGKRYDENGDLVDAVRPEYRIDDTTRDMIRQTIADGLDENIGMDEIAANIEDSYGFSEERADLIARTEISRANSEGALEGARGARDELGLGIKKVWLLAPDYQDQDDDGICQDNADDGPIDIDDQFSSGDDTVPAHPNCRCVVTFETDDGQNTGDEEDA